MFSFSQLLKDPPPSFAFELSEAGIACAKVGAIPDIRFQPFDTAVLPPVLTVSPVHDNVTRPDALATHIEALAPANGARKRRAALILPDYAARVSVLDFDSLPSGHDEQRALVRFRMKKSVPFDVDNAMVSFHIQPKAAVEGARIEVLVAVIANEIVSRYEEPFRQLGFLPGFVTTSSLGALNMIEPDGVTLIVKLNGGTLTAIVLDGAVVKLVRCVELTGATREELEAVVLPTLAYIEDELSAAPKRILLCGLGMLGDQIRHEWARDWGVSIDSLRSRYGAPGPLNAGLLGYLESLA